MSLARPVGTTPVNASQYTERPSIKLKVSGGRSNIHNSVIVDAAGRSLFSIKSNSRRTTLASCKNNVKIAKVKWNRLSPCMDFRGKKMTCEEWLPPVRPESKYVMPNPAIACDDSECARARSRLLTHGDAQFTWMDLTDSGYVRICSHYNISCWD